MIKKYWIRKLFIIWELPQFMLGIFFLFFLFLKRSVKKKLRYKTVDFYFVENFPGGISLSGIIIINKIEGHLLNSRSIKTRHAVFHEYGHSIQSLWFGWFYLPLVGLPSLIRSIIWNKNNKEESRYYGAYPENWADRLGKKYI